MKALFSFVAMVLLLNFVGFTHAADPVAKPKHHHGLLISLDTAANELTYKGTKENSKPHTIKVSEKAEITLDKKEIKLGELKPGYYLNITDEDGTATTIVASTTPPAPKAK